MKGGQTAHRYLKHLLAVFLALVMVAGVFRRDQIFRQTTWILGVAILAQ